MYFEIRYCLGFRILIIRVLSRYIDIHEGYRTVYFPEINILSRNIRGYMEHGRGVDHLHLVFRSQGDLRFCGEIGNLLRIPAHQDAESVVSFGFFGLRDGGRFFHHVEEYIRVHGVVVFADEFQFGTVIGLVKDRVLDDLTYPQVTSS